MPTINQANTATNAVTVSTETTFNGEKFCRITSDMSVTDAPIKPISFFVSDERNQVEMFILTQTLQALGERMGGVLPEVNILNAQSNLDTQRRCFEHIIQSPNTYGVNICLSPWMSAGAYHHLTMNGITAPLLFGNITSDENSKLEHVSWANGVGTHPQQYRRQLMTIKDLMPSLRRILLPHDMLLHGVENSAVDNGNVRALIDECDNQNIEVVMLGTLPVSKLARDIKQYSTADSLFVLTRENTVMNQMHDIINVCNNHGMPIFSDLPLPTLNGAAFGTGTSGVDIAQPLAEMIYQVAVLGRRPGTLAPVTVAESDLLLYNKQNFAQQGIQVSNEQLRLLEAQEILLYARDQQLI